MRFAVAVAGTILAMPTMAVADDWHFHTHGKVRIQSDNTYRAPTKSEEINNTYAKAELEVELSYLHQFILFGHLKLEPVYEAEGDTFFKNHGAWVDQLYMKYDSGTFEVFAGKFNPLFGFRDDDKPIYMYGRDFMEDYELLGAIGVGGAVKHNSVEWGEHQLGGTVYFLDSTVLSTTAFYRPRFDDPRTERVGRLKKRDGGVGNTGSLESFTIGAAGGKFGFAPGLEYTLGYRQQKRGENDLHSEKGFIGGLAYEIVLGKGLTLTPLVEYAQFDKFEGTNTKARYLTGSALLEYGPWSLQASYTDRRLKFSSEEESGKDNDRLFQVTAGYTFDFGLGLYAGWKTQKVANETSESFGIMALYKFEF